MIERLVFEWVVDGRCWDGKGGSELSVKVFNEYEWGGMNKL